MSELPHSRKSRAVPSGSVDPTSSTTATAGTNNPTMISPGTTTRAMFSSSSLHHSHHHHSNNITTLSPMQYVQRLLDISQMDIQSALDQMKTLISTRPQIVYKTCYYRKQTKNHWCRDDPAFVALQVVFLIIACVAYSIAFRIKFPGWISFLFYSIFINWFFCGILVASVCREIANRHLNTAATSSATQSSLIPPLISGGNNSTPNNNNNNNNNTTQQQSLHVRQQVEWLYAFDIHCNSFFPVFVVLYGLQFFALPVALGEGFLSLFVANTLYAVAFVWYWYITHLGYRQLPFLYNTEVFLFPTVAIILFYIMMLIGYPLTGFGWNMARVMARFYFVQE